MVDGFGVSRQDLVAVARSYRSVVGPINKEAQAVRGTSVSGATVGEPFYHQGEQYRAMMEGIAASMQDYALRVESIANALDGSAATYDTTEAGNTQRFTGDIYGGM